MPETAFEAGLSLYYLIWGKGIPLFGTVKGKPLFSGGFPADVFSFFCGEKRSKRN